MNKIIKYIIIVSLSCSSCSINIPKEYTESHIFPDIYPDYTDLIIPPNIAPLNFKINNKAEEYITCISGNKGNSIVIKGNTIQIKESKWKNILENNKGDSYKIEIFIKNNGKWSKLSAIENYISQDNIDPYLSYRLIEPGYVVYKKISLKQRNLTNFQEKDIFNNNIIADNNNYTCLNCHAYQNYQTSNMQFHARGELGGTMIVSDGKLQKVDLKTDDLISAGVYPAWHPHKKLIAYSVNQTGQVFHSKDLQKVEVQDLISDLILYDVENNSISYIVNNENDLETFPAWSPDGKTLYYSSAQYMPELGNRSQDIIVNYRNIKYNILSIPFSSENKTFGIADTVFNAQSINKSATLPRISPDGKYLLFTLGDYGNFHIWHKSSDLWIMNLETKEAKKLENVNSEDVESYHTWSSNGRWIVFSSRRDDGSYTRPYLSYFNEKGQASKPFIVPQKDPDFYPNFYKSYNIPEFMIEPVKTSVHEFAVSMKKVPVKASLK